MNKIFIYDFDGTLTPFPYPKFEIIEKCGFENSTMNPKFLELVIKCSKDNNIGLYDAYYKVYFKLLKDNNYSFSNDNLSLGADRVVYNKGVHEFLEKLNDNGVKNYLLSSGIKVHLEKTNIASYFEKIYATTFNYKDNEVTSINFLMSDNNKITAIKDIMKLNNLENCNDIVYIGDGLTDLYAMQYVKDNGGNVIFVSADLNSKDVKTMKDKNIVDLFSLTDYSTGSEIDKYTRQLCNIKTTKTK